MKSQTAVSVLTTYGGPHEVPGLPACCVTTNVLCVCVAPVHVTPPLSRPPLEITSPARSHIKAEGS